jgi:hypothetical protein
VGTAERAEEWGEKPTGEGGKTVEVVVRVRSGVGYLRVGRAQETVRN